MYRDNMRYHEFQSLEQRAQSARYALLCGQCRGVVILFQKDLMFVRRIVTGQARVTDPELTMENIANLTARKLYRNYDLLPEVEGLRSPDVRRTDGVSAWMKEQFLEKLCAIDPDFRTRPSATLAYIFQHDLSQLDAVIECCEELISELEAAGRT